MKYQIQLLACSLLLLNPLPSVAGKKPAPQPQVSPTAITPAAAAFLDNAIDIMRQHALHAEGVDWTAVRTEAFKRAGGAFNPIDTYPAIYWALVQLGDPGSHLRLPPGLYPDQIALLQQAEREAQNSAPGGPRTDTAVPTAFTSRRLPEGHIVTAQGRNFGYVVLPRCSAKDNDGLLLYAADVRRILTDLTSQNPQGWIVDLRGNTGGNMWPMMTGIGWVNFPLYTFSGDLTYGTNCAQNAACARAWPVAYTSGSPGYSGVPAAGIGVTVLSSGLSQVTWNGHPLYLFSHEALAPTSNGGAAPVGNGNGIKAFGGTFSLVVNP